jgi:hypothetical protein
MTTLNPTAQARRTSKLTFRHPIITIPTKVKSSTNCLKAKETETSINKNCKSSKSKWKTKSKESLQLNGKRLKREIRNMKKPKDNFQFPNKEQDPLQSSEMAAILEILKFPTELPRNKLHSQ